MIRLEQMTDAHVAQIAQLEKQCFSDPWSENSVASELNNCLSLWLVALDGATVAGYIGSQSVGDEADMMNVAVHPDYRRRGIARMLVQELIAQVDELETANEQLRAEIDNACSRKTCGACGAVNDADATYCNKCGKELD